MHHISYECTSEKLLFYLEKIYIHITCTHANKQKELLRATFQNFNIDLHKSSFTRANDICNRHVK